MTRSRLLILLLLCSAACAAETGMPFMTAYPSKEFGGHTQFWSIEQDDRGVMYIGDGYGIQEFDGTNWRLITNANHSFGRSLCKDENGRIYAGSSGMLGYLEANERGEMQYRSLLEFIPPEDRLFNYVWSVYATPAGVYFQTNERLFRFHPPESSPAAGIWTVDVWRPQDTFGYTFWVDQTLYVQQYGIGLMKMVNDSLVVLQGGEQFANDRIHVMLPFPGKKGHYLVGTFSRGLFDWDGSIFRPWPSDADRLIADGTLYAGVVTPDSCFALGTMANGLVIIDRHGRLVQHFTQSSSFLSNTVSCLFLDQQRNLWVGMDGGVAVLEYDSPFSEYSIPGGTGPSDFRRYQGILYIAANDGVYYLDDSDGAFKLVPGIVGLSQSFFFHEINNELFVTVNQGVYRIHGKTASMALPVEDLSRPILCMCDLSMAHQAVVAGTNLGVDLLRYDASSPHRLVRIGRIAGIHEYIRMAVEAEPGVVWLGTMDSGVIRLTFNAERLLDPVIEKFGTQHGLPPGGAVFFKPGGRPVFCTKKGVYQFDPAQNRFLPDPFFNEMGLGRNPDESIIVADGHGNLWINLGKESAVYKKLPDSQYKLEKAQLARFSDEVINTIYPESNGVVWYGTANNVIRFAPNQDQSQLSDFPAIIRRVVMAGDSVVYYGAALPGHRLHDPAAQRFPFRGNALRFDFSASSYLNPRANSFRTRLEGFDAGWSAWSRDTRRDYTNLPADKYRFRVQARNIFQQESSEDLYAFTITPPWYNTWWAWAFYLLCAGGLIFGLIRARTRQLVERSRALEKIVQERTAEIQEQKNNVEQLSLIGREITATLSIGNIIHTIYQNVNQLMDASVFGIGLFNAEKQTLDFPGTTEKNELLPPYSLSLSDENRLAVWCYKNQQDVIINDYARDFSAYIQQLQAPVAGENPESILYLPLTYKDKRIGVITAQSFKKNSYTDYHLNMLRNLATYSAIALENADAYHRVNELLADLKNTQEKLVTQSKLAALGALTAGIAHEIKNPLNFVNNFAELITDLVAELREVLITDLGQGEKAKNSETMEILDTLQQNAAKIIEHGKRADSIVKSMLQHSRGKSDERQPTDINAVLAEDINLAYHGMRAQDSSFNIKIETDFDPAVGKLSIVPQDVSRVFLNIISNGCYEAHRKKQEQNGEFSPTLSVKTRSLQNLIEVRIRDNGNGIPVAIREKLFTPFFTTKPPGKGTGLGLSISYDVIVHQHGGQLYFESEEGQFAEFIIQLPK
ncbi:MAG TPA: ATP-binding protein [bacterium]|nr:ATP-binding protein [bacterium]